MTKLKSVEYAKDDGKLIAYEKYEDGSRRKVQIKNGMVDYILTGEGEEVK